MSPQRKNRTLHALLGFLTWGPMSGYDIKKVIEGSIGYFWSESYGRIYPMLKRLADEGLATRESSTTEGGRDRHTYSLTDAGRDALQEWLAESAEPDPVRSELLLKLFFGAQTDIAISRRHIEQHRARMARMVDEYDAVRAELQQCHPGDSNLPFWLLTLRNGELSRKASMQWCDEALEVLDAIEREQGGARQQETVPAGEIQ